MKRDIELETMASHFARAIPKRSAVRRACLVGAGFIAHAHAEAVHKSKCASAVAVVDPNRSSAEALAKRWQIQHVFGSAEEAIRAGVADAAHILAPPPAHFELARKFLAAGMDVLIEKPMAVTSRDCRELAALAEAKHLTLAVNQNSLFQTPFQKLENLVASGQLGPLRSIDCQFQMPLAQFTARQFGHWMFAKPENILLEQAVHPLAQILRLAGKAEEISVLTGEPYEMSPSNYLYRSWQIGLCCAHSQAQLAFAVAREFPCWRITVLCDDGSATADMLADQLVVRRRSRWPDFADHFLAARDAARQIVHQGRRNFCKYLLSTLRLQPRTDPFYIGIAGSIDDFYGAARQSQAPRADGQFGTEVIELCERIVERSRIQARPEPPAVVTRRRGCDVAIVGGTGFIGAHLVKHLVDEGRRVSVIARNTRNLPAVFAHPLVTLIQGDVHQPESLREAIAGAECVVNLAHGASAAGGDAMVSAMVKSARQIAQSCLEQGIRKLVHISSIAALYLGDRRQQITGQTIVDLDPTRDAYTRGKAESEVLLAEFCLANGLQLCILRPGVVIGIGGTPFHSGLGMFNNSQHCLGWNNGQNPLPFVLAEDVAQAIALAAAHDGVAGMAYNLVGDVRLTAREYIDALSRALRRPLRFHAQPMVYLAAAEMFKWFVKRTIGRKDPLPSLRDMKSRGMVSAFNCDDTKRDLGWRPISDRNEFVRRAIEVHASFPLTCNS